MASVKKSSVKKSPKISTPKKSSKPKQIDAKLQDAFRDSLAKLETFWAKKTTDLKKQIETLRSQSDKAALKQKANKNKQVQSKTATKTQLQQASLHQDLIKARESLAQAKLATRKYANLTKLITQFERDWQKESAESPKNSASPVKKTSKATVIKEMPAPSKRGRKPKAVGHKSSPATSTDTEVAAKETINKPTRQSKNQKLKSPTVIQASPLLDEVENSEDLFETTDMNEIFTSLDEPLDDVLAEFEMAEESEDYLDEDSFED